MAGGNVWSAPLSGAVRSVDFRWVGGNVLWTIGVVAFLATLIAGLVMAILDLRLISVLPVSVFLATLVGCFVVLLTRLMQVASHRTNHAVAALMAHNAVVAVIGVATVAVYSGFAADPASATYARIALTWIGGGVASVVGMLLADANTPEAGAMPAGTQVGAVEGDQSL